MLDRLRPSRTVARITELDCNELIALGIRGVIIDLDNTLTRWRSLEISPDVVAWIAGLRAAGIRACIVSNAASTGRVRPVADRLGIPWVTRAVKPLSRGYRHAMQLMGTTPETTAAIGDQVFTDIFGGNRLGLYTVLVDPISPQHEAIVTKLIQRPLERLIGRKPK